MKKINSDSKVAGELATQLFVALDELNGSLSAIVDVETTVVGNTHAETAINSLTTAVTQINSVIGDAANNLNSVASEFEAADQTLRNMLDLSSSLGVRKW